MKRSGLIMEAVSKWSSRRYDAKHSEEENQDNEYIYSSRKKQKNSTKFNNYLKTRKSNNYYFITKNF